LFKLYEAGTAFHGSTGSVFRAPTVTDYREAAGYGTAPISFFGGVNLRY
jgi:hypothetical protein